MRRRDSKLRTVEEVMLCALSMDPFWTDCCVFGKKTKKMILYTAIENSYFEDSFTVLERLGDYIKQLTKQEVYDVILYIEKLNKDRCDLTHFIRVYPEFVLEKCLEIAMNGSIKMARYLLLDYGDLSIGYIDDETYEKASEKILEKYPDIYEYYSETDSDSETDSESETD